MRLLLPAFASTALLGAILFACSGSEDPDASNAESDYTRQGGVVGQAPKIALGKPASGSIKNAQIDAWAIDLRVGDKITVVETIQKGTLTPDFGLFGNGVSHVQSTSHEVLPKKLTKHYVIPSAGRYVIGVAPYQGKGSGDYSIKITCTGGPCAGQAPVVELEAGQKNSCIKKARECAFQKARPTDGSSVTLTKARAAWKTCLEAASLPGGESCKMACAEGDAKITCDEITRMIPFYAKKPASCTSELESCMSDCEQAGDNSEISEEQCLTNGFNGTCNAYVRTLVACGGAHTPDSAAACHKHCESTAGAWIDDLDTICTESCPELEE